jgi:hypothetical protein
MPLVDLSVKVETTPNGETKVTFNRDALVHASAEDLARDLAASRISVRPPAAASKSSTPEHKRR